MDAVAAQPRSTGGSPVVVIVKVPKPWYAPNWLVERKMRDAVPQYRQIPGLTFKIFTFARPGGEFGGVYLWNDRASAQAWFGPAWYKRVRDERGVEPEVRMYEATRVVAGTADTDPDPVDNAVVTFITRAKAGTDAGVPLMDPRAPDLLRAYILDAADNRSSGVYLWRDEAAARRALDSAWQRGQQASSGSAPRIEWFDAPILTLSTLPANREADRAMTSAPAR